ncbi:Protein SEC13-like protein [Plecturocebus cupreus]
MVSVINTVDSSHEDMIHDTQMDYYGTRLATCSSDRSVQIFSGGQILITDLRGHGRPVWQVVWAHPVYSNIPGWCSSDQKVIIWTQENSTWEKSHKHAGHNSPVNSLCWAPMTMA